MMRAVEPVADGTRESEREHVTAVIPALNEELTIGSVVLAARAYCGTVIVVDDGSTDRTGPLAEQAGAVVVRLPANGGKGAALRAGFEAAAALGAPILVTLDADGQHDPSDIPALVAPLIAGDADVVVGSRRSDGESRGRIPMHRRAGQRLFSGMARVAADARTADSESGFRAYRASFLQGLSTTEPGYAADWELLAEARRRGARIVDVPVAVRYDVPRPSKRAAVAHGWDVGQGILRTVRLERPFLFFGVPGLVLLLVGLVLGAQTAAGYYGAGVFWPGKAMLSMLALLLGTLGVLAGLILGTLADMIRRLDARRAAGPVGPERPPPRQ